MQDIGIRRSLMNLKHVEIRGYVLNAGGLIIKILNALMDISSTGKEKNVRVLRKMTLEEYIEDYERQVSQKDKLLKQIEKDQPEKRTLTVKRLTESKKQLETMLGLLKELKEYRDAGRENDE